MVRDTEMLVEVPVTPLKLCGGHCTHVAPKPKNSKVL